MARRDSKSTGAPCKQGRRPKRSSHCSCTPEQAQIRRPARRQADHVKFNGNSTVIQMLHLIDNQASTNEALRDKLNHEKTNSAVLASHLQETMTKANGYNQCLATTTAELCSTKQMLQYTTEHLERTQDELQQANELIQTKDYLLQRQEGTICSLNANIEELKQQLEALARRSKFTQKQLAYEGNDCKTRTAELKECRERLAAAELKSKHWAEHKAQLQAAVAGNYSALLSAALARDGSGYRQLLWLFMLLVLAAVQSCVLLHVLMLSTFFMMLAKGLPAAPWLWGEARVYAVVSWALVCDLLRYLGACAAVYCSSAYASCVGLLYDISRYAKSLVCSHRSASLNFWASSSEKLLPYLSWGSARTSSAGVTPASSSRSSISVDAIAGHVQDDVAADVIAVVSLKQGLVLGKVADSDV